jgi:hypothetical protein
MPFTHTENFAKLFNLYWVYDDYFKLVIARNILLFLICAIFETAFCIYIYFKYDAPIFIAQDKLASEISKHQEILMRTREGRWRFYYSDLSQLNKKLASIFFEDANRNKIASNAYIWESLIF